MSAEVWAPITFEVGQRVRVRLSAECRHRFVPTEEDGITVIPEGMYGHESGEDEAVGAVIDISREEINQFGFPTEGHWYEVEFNDPVPASHGWVLSSMYTASELEPLR